MGKAFNGAEELEVEISRSSWAIGGYDTLEGFVSVRDMRRAKVHGIIGVRFTKWLESAEYLCKDMLTTTAHQSTQMSLIFRGNYAPV